MSIIGRRRNGASCHLVPARRLLVWLALPLTAAVAPADRAALTAGQTRLSRAELGAWLDELPSGRFSTKGKRAVRDIPMTVENVLVPEALLLEHARRTLEPDAGYTERRDQAFALALERDLAKSIQVSEEEVQAFYERHQQRYVKPHAIHIWRILTKDEAKAREVIAGVKEKGRLAVYEWTNLARAYSLDDATKHRAGDLGMVRQDGSTDVPQVRVNSSLYAAVAELADGEMLDHPVREGENFAALWRRGSREASTQSLQSQRATIVDVITRHKLQQALAKEVERLREQHLSDHHPELLESVVFPPPDLLARPPKDEPSDTNKPARKRSQDAPRDSGAAAATASTTTSRAAPSPKKTDRGER